MAEETSQGFYLLYCEDVVEKTCLFERQLSFSYKMQSMSSSQQHKTLDSSSSGAKTQILTLHRF